MKIEAQRTINPIEKMRIEEKRRLVNEAILGSIPLLAVGLGQCSFTLEHIETTEQEALENTRTMIRQQNLFIIQRRNYWKPRSNPADWHGIDSTHPELATELHCQAANNGIPLCGELAHDEHINRYAPGMTFGWRGSRNEDLDFLIYLALSERTMPLPIKNKMDGTVESALEEAQLVNTIRANTGGGARAFLMHRGGALHNTPKKWEEALREVLEATGGECAEDLAHGTEQAHDPSGNFQKSAEAQIRAAEHYIKVCEKLGIWARMLLIEASDAPSATDPNMPHARALEIVTDIANQMHPGANDILG